MYLHKIFVFAICPTKPKIFTIWPLQKTVCQPQREKEKRAEGQGSYDTPIQKSGQGKGSPAIEAGKQQPGR